jgi:hypothetical protein
MVLFLQTFVFGLMFFYNIAAQPKTQIERVLFVLIYAALEALFTALLFPQIVVIFKKNQQIEII